MKGKVVGVDLGSRRVGVAVSDSARSLAFPRGIVRRTGDPDADRRAIAEVVAEEGATTLVVGLPLSLDGRRGPAARAAAAEAERLAATLAATGVAVEVFDERLTTVSARSALVASGGARSGRPRAKGQHHHEVDDAAATVILQAWLDAQPPEEP